VIALAFMGLGLVATARDVTTVIVVLGALAALALLLARRMPPAERMVDG